MGGKKAKKRERGKRAFHYQKGLFSENCLKLQRLPHLVRSRKLCIVPRTKILLAECYEEELRQVQKAQNFVVWETQGGRKCRTSGHFLLPSIQTDRGAFQSDGKEGSGSKTALGSKLLVAAGNAKPGITFS